MTAPMLSLAMASGMIRRQDPEMLAHWLLRIALAALVAPPPGDLRTSFEGLLLPVLTPERPGR
jgi:hypothetical protein